MRNHVEMSHIPYLSLNVTSNKEQGSKEPRPRIQNMYSLVLASEREREKHTHKM